MPLLRIQLLGDFVLLFDDEPVAGYHQARLQSLLAYLLLRRHAPQSRQHLAFLFWSDSTETQARTNLRKALYHIRRNLPDAARFLQSDAKSVQWMADAPFTLDVADFEEALAQADEALQNEQPGAARSHLSHAVALYRGELLPRCYDDWVLPERERLHQRALDALARLMQALEDAREYAAAIRYGQRLLILDPVHETTYRHLMRLHVLHGDRAGALSIYHTCVDVLRRELAVEPSADTHALYARLLRMDVPVSARAQLPKRANPERLIGRAGEWRQLQAAWRVAAEMQPHLVLIAGEAGIGKSHLAAEMQQWAAQQGITTAHARSYAAAGGLAYAPVIDWLRSAPFVAALAALEPIWRSEIARLLPELLEDDPHLPRPQPLTERWQRQRLFEALTRTVLRVNGPLLLVLDDLQWCDGETLEWLHFLLRSAATLAEQSERVARLLVVGTVRPEEVDEQHPLTPLRLHLRRDGQSTEIELGPLDADETAALARQVADRPLDSGTTHHLYQASEGSPLFVVEMVRSGQGWLEIESPTTPAGLQSPLSDSPSLPPKVHAVIQSRLMQLSPAARNLADLAATIGRSFTFDVLAQARDGDEDGLVRGLDELWQRRIVREQGVNAYDFSHDRIREVAYATIRPAQRQRLHRRVAAALEHLHAADLDAVSGQIGFHCEQARQLEEAVKFYRRAADLSAGIYAFENTLFYLNRALGLMEDLPSTDESAQQKIEMWLTSGDIFTVTKGWTSVERKQAFEDAAELARQVENDLLLFDALYGLYGYYANTGDWHTCRHLSREFLLLAEAHQDQSRLRRAYMLRADQHLQMGKFPLGLRYSRCALEIEDIIGPHHQYSVSWHSRMAESLWFCGYPEQAQRINNAAIRLTDEQQHPYDRIHCREFAMYVYQRTGNRSVVRRLASEITELCERFGFANYALSARILTAWTMVESGRIEEGILLITRALHELDKLGDQFNRPYFGSLLAHAQLAHGAITDALETLARAMDFVAHSGDQLWAAEIHRLMGDCRLRLGDADAEASYESALRVARRQGGKSLELRAATSLARLWQSQGKDREAHDLLAPVYNWFTEGFDIHDLRAAKALLDELYAEISS